jgi:hypothetical protein
MMTSGAAAFENRGEVVKITYRLFPFGVGINRDNSNSKQRTEEPRDS